MFPRTIGSAWEIFTPAKLNLHLEVLGKRDDGFHELETIMVPVRVYDTLRWSQPDTSNSDTRLSLRIIDRSPGPEDPTLGSAADNLISRAVNLLAESAGCMPGGSFTLVKRIPTRGWDGRRE